jgi:hypothetical protein
MLRTILVVSIFILPTLVPGVLAQSAPSYSNNTTTPRSVRRLQNTSVDPKLQIRQLINELLLAITRKDKGVLDKLLDDDFMQTNLSGGVQNKIQFLESFDNDGEGIDTEVVNVNVRFYGNVAVAHCEVRMVRTLTIGSTVFRETDVLVKTKGRWRFVSSQLTWVEKSERCLGQDSAPVNCSGAPPTALHSSPLRFISSLNLGSPRIGSN